LGEKGRSALFEKFAVEQTAQQMLRIYQQTIRQFMPGGLFQQGK